MNNIKYWCAVGKMKQLAFHDNGSQYEIEVEHLVGEQHIVYMEVLLCKQSRDTLKNKFGAKKQRTVQNRILGVKLCSRCEKLFKENQNLGWQKWVNPPEPNKAKTIEINPAFLDTNNEK